MSFAWHRVWFAAVISLAIGAPHALAQSSAKAARTTRQLLFPDASARISSLDGVVGSAVVGCSARVCKLSITVGWEAGACKFTGYRPIVWLDKTVEKVIWYAIPDRTNGVQDVRFDAPPGSVLKTIGVQMLDRYSPKEDAGDPEWRVWLNQSATPNSVEIALAPVADRKFNASSYRGYFEVHIEGDPPSKWTKCLPFDPIIINDGD